MLWGIHRHYETVRRHLHSGAVRVGEPAENKAVLVVTEFDAATAEALGYVRSFRPREFHPVYVGPRPRQEVDMLWQALCRGGGPQITFLGSGGARAVLGFIRGIGREPNDFISVVIPELFRKRSLLHAALALRLTFWLKVRLLSQPSVVISNVPVLREGNQLLGVDARPLIPTRVEALVFVGDVNDAVVRAVNYALALDAAETRAVYVALEPGEDLGGKLRQWSEYRMPVPLQIVEGPFRDLGPPVLEEVRRVTADGSAVAAVIMPEFLVSRWWHRALHNNRGFFIKRLLLFEPRVILSSVPYPLGHGTRERARDSSPEPARGSSE
jgi:hypothetical protein